MATVKQDVFEVFYQLLYDNKALEQFEQWVYQTPELEVLVQEEAHLSLLSFDYQQPEASVRLKHLLREICETIWPDRLIKERVKELLCGLITGNKEVIETCRELAYLRQVGYSWIPLEYVGFDSILDDEVPHPAIYHLMDQEALKKKLVETEPMMASIRARAEEIARQFLAENYDEPYTDSFGLKLEDKTQ